MKYYTAVVVSLLQVLFAQSAFIFGFLPLFYIEPQKYSTQVLSAK